jgi:chemotaxis protein methyltransferase CheR
MRPSVELPLVERFRLLIARRLGLQFEDAKRAWLADLLVRHAESAPCDIPTYLARLECGAARDEIGALAQELTVSETYFFRNIEQFHALRECVATDRLRARAATRCLRILSAGCASGEEAYSIAMTLRDMLPDPSWELVIHAIDLNPAMIRKAQCARYSSWALRETPIDMQQRWFRRDGSNLVLDDTIRAAVRFNERNLHDDDSEWWPSDFYDVVFCRNVLMYFTPQGARSTVARIARALAPGCFLFLGHTDTLRGLSQDFHLRHTHGTFYYQRKNPRESAAADAQPEDTCLSDVTSPMISRSEEGADDWVEAIGKAAERVRMLTAQAMLPSSRGTASSAGCDSHLGRVFDLFREERFADALGLVQALPPESAQAPDMLLLNAALLAHSGQFNPAEAACQRLLAIDPTNAGAHYVLALCCEAAGDQIGARGGHQRAVHLDPGFAMPRLHLGLLARRSGDLDAVRRELGQALLLLQREDASRLLLFGGGFNRDALLALCRAELCASAGVL